MRDRPWLVVALAWVATACGDPTPAEVDGGLAADAAVDAAPPSWPFALPPGFPVPRLPPGNGLTAELAELGRYLFHDRRLSANGTLACAGCHLQAQAFADGKVTPSGSTGDVLRRNSMALVNVAYNPSYTWANPTTTTLELQAMIPIFGKHPIELGVVGHEGEIVERLATDADYPARFAAAFPGQPAPITWPNVIRALAGFQRRMISGDSRVDRFQRGDATALTPSEQRGQVLFYSETLECVHCHGGFNFTIAVDHALLPTQQSQFFNNGLYNIAGTGAYPEVDQGLWEFTFEAKDSGRFRPPTLRNIAVTAPYMHDGSLATLEDVLAMYERGGRLITSGPYAGDGRANPYKSPFVGGFTLTPEERAELLGFLRALTDDTFLNDPALADPFPAP